LIVAAGLAVKRGQIAQDHARVRIAGPEHPLKDGQCLAGRRFHFAVAAQPGTNAAKVVGRDSDRDLVIPVARSNGFADLLETRDGAIVVGPFESGQSFVKGRGTTAGFQS
jgi:hypothetical protein